MGAARSNLIIRIGELTKIAAFESWQMLSAELLLALAVTKFSELSASILVRILAERLLMEINSSATQEGSDTAFASPQWDLPMYSILDTNLSAGRCGSKTSSSPVQHCAAKCRLRTSDIPIPPPFC
jgi:hypothetical protein